MNNEFPENGNAWPPENGGGRIVLILYFMAVSPRVLSDNVGREVFSMRRESD